METKSTSRISPLNVMQKARINEGNLYKSGYLQ